MTDAFPAFARRELLAGLLPAFAALALVREARLAAAEGPAPITVRRWADGQQEIAEALAAGRITGAQWAQNVRELGGAVDLAELGAFIARAEISPARRGAHNDPAKRFVRFRDEGGAVQRLAYGAALFDFAPANVVTPHGHKHMVSAHMVLSGRLRVRNFDRVGDVPGAMLLRATKDYVAEPGIVSTMCAEADNVHWFVPVGGAATTFDLVISDLDPGQPSYVIEAIDPLAAKPRGKGIAEVPIIGFEDASKRYHAGI